MKRRHDIRHMKSYVMSLADACTSHMLTRQGRIDGPEVLGSRGSGAEGVRNIACWMICISTCFYHLRHLQVEAHHFVFRHRFHLPSSMARSCFGQHSLRVAAAVCFASGLWTDFTHEQMREPSTVAHRLLGFKSLTLPRVALIF